MSLRKGRRGVGEEEDEEEGEEVGGGRRGNMFLRRDLEVTLSCSPSTDTSRYVT